MEALDITDEELEALALGAQVDGPLPHDAEPLDLTGLGPATLPDWYMPPANAPVATGGVRRRVVVWSIVGAFAAINVAGMCSTYGTVGFG